MREVAETAQVPHGFDMVCKQNKTYENI